MLNSTVTEEGVLQGFVTDDFGNQILVRVDIVEMPGIGRNLFSVTTTAKNIIVAIFNSEDSRLERFNATVPLPSEIGDLDSFVLNLSANGYGAKELAINEVANVHMWR